MLPLGRLTHAFGAGLSFRRPSPGFLARFWLDVLPQVRSTAPGHRRTWPGGGPVPILLNHWSGAVVPARGAGYRSPKGLMGNSIEIPRGNPSGLDTTMELKNMHVLR